MEKILFLESKKVIENLGIWNMKTNDNEVFDGAKNYKKTLKNIKDYDLIISVFYNDPINNLIIGEAKLSGVRTLLLTDGIIEWSNMFKNNLQKKYGLNLFHPIIHDILYVIGKREKDYFIKTQDIEVKNYMINRITQKKEALIPLPKSVRFLITTSNTPYYDDKEFFILTKIIKNIQKSLEELKINYKFRIYDKKIIKKLNISPKINDTDNSFTETLKKYSSVITTASSIMLTSMYHQRSVGQILFRNSPVFIQSGWNISRSENINETLVSMSKKEKSRMQYQSYELTNYYEIDSLDKFDNLKSKKMDAKFINKNMYNMLNSKFNFNIQWLVRKIYSFFKKTKLKNILKKWRNKIK